MEFAGAMKFIDMRMEWRFEELVAGNFDEYFRPIAASLVCCA